MLRVDPEEQVFFRAVPSCNCLNPLDVDIGILAREGEGVDVQVGGDKHGSGDECDRDT